MASYIWKHHDFSRNCWSCITFIMQCWFIFRLCGKNCYLWMERSSMPFDACLARKKNSAFKSHHCLIGNEIPRLLTWEVLKLVSNRTTSRSSCTYRSTLLLFCRIVRIACQQEYYPPIQAYQAYLEGLFRVLQQHAVKPNKPAHNRGLCILLSLLK